MLRLFVIGMSFFVMVSVARASEMGLVGGLITTDVDVKAAGMSKNSGSGYQLGTLGLIEMGKVFNLRVGALYTQRKFEVADNDIEINYMDVPVTGLIMFNEMIGLFGGVDLGLRVSDNSSPNQLTDVASVVYGATLGGHFRFFPNFGMELSYHLGLSNMFGDNAFGAQNPKGFAVNAMYWF